MFYIKPWIIVAGVILILRIMFVLLVIPGKQQVQQYYEPHWLYIANAWGILLLNKTFYYPSRHEMFWNRKKNFVDAFC